MVDSPEFDPDKILAAIQAEEAELKMLRTFYNEVGAALAEEGPATIEHLLATASLGKHTTVIGRKRLEALYAAEKHIQELSAGDTEPATEDSLREIGAEGLHADEPWIGWADDYGHAITFDYVNRTLWVYGNQVLHDREITVGDVRRLRAAICPTPETNRAKV